MKYLEQTTTENKRFVDYLKGSLIFIFFNFIGQIPLSLYIISQSDLVGEFTSHQDLFSKLPSNPTLFLILLPFAVVLPFIYLVVTRLHQRSFLSLITSRDRVDYKKILFSFFLWGTVSALMVIFDYMMSPEDYVWNFKPLTFLILLFISVVMIPLQTSMEELIFRGYLMQGFGVLFKNRWMPLLITSILFGLLHIWNPEIDKLGIHLIWYYIGTGLFLGVITLMDEGIELALGFPCGQQFGDSLIGNGFLDCISNRILTYR
jgi:membrane protease YdiL (CAAX protease family)